MSRKPKFKPEIRRVKLNPEQAVLACACYSNGWKHVAQGNQNDGTRFIACYGSKLTAGPNLCLFGLVGGFINQGAVPSATSS